MGVAVPHRRNRYGQDSFGQRYRQLFIRCGDERLSDTGLEVTCASVGFGRGLLNPDDRSDETSISALVMPEIEKFSTARTVWVA